MSRTYSLSILVIVHLLALLALGGFVHGIQHTDSTLACPIPLAMGVDCDSVADEGDFSAHVFSGIDYVISLLSVSLVPLFALIVVFVAYTLKRGTRKRSAHVPLLERERHFLSVLTVRFRRFRRWMTVMRSDMLFMRGFRYLLIQ